MKRLVVVIDELQAIVENSDGHWIATVRELRLANEILHQKKDQLISSVRKLGVARCVGYLAFYHSGG